MIPQANTDPRSGREARRMGLGFAQSLVLFTPALSFTPSTTPNKLPYAEGRETSWKAMAPAPLPLHIIR